MRFADRQMLLDSHNFLVPRLRFVDPAGLQRHAGKGVEGDSVIE